MMSSRVLRFRAVPGAGPLVGSRDEPGAGPLVGPRGGPPPVTRIETRQRSALLVAIPLILFTLLSGCSAPGPDGMEIGTDRALVASGAIWTDTTLASELESLVEGFRGEVGIYLRHLGSGAEVAIRADEVYPTASLIKVPIMLAVYDQVERGILDLDAELPYPDTLHYQYVEHTDVVGYMDPGELLPLSELIFLMQAVSDNVASLWLQALVGGGVVVNEWLAAHGFEVTRVNSRTPDREEARTRYGWGQTSPREIAEQLVMIREGRAVSPAASEAMYRMLTKSYWQEQALSQVPPTVQVASKQGFVSRSRSEVLLVNAPTGDYVLAVITRDQEDTGYDHENEGYRLIRSVSRRVYEYFNPDDGWRPGGAVVVSSAP